MCACVYVCVSVPHCLPSHLLQHTQSHIHTTRAHTHTHTHAHMHTPPPPHTQALRAQWFNDTYGPRRLNLQDYHQLCSYGKVVWGPDNNIIVGPVEVRAFAWASPFFHRIKHGI